MPFFFFFFTLVRFCYETIQICSIPLPIFQKWMKIFFCALNIVYDLRVLCGKRLCLEPSPKLFMIKGVI